MNLNYNRAKPLRQAHLACSERYPTPVIRQQGAREARVSSILAPGFAAPEA